MHRPLFSRRTLQGMLLSAVSQHWLSRFQLGRLNGWHIVEGHPFENNRIKRFCFKNDKNSKMKTKTETLQRNCHVNLRWWKPVHVSVVLTEEFHSCLVYGIWRAQLVKQDDYKPFNALEMVSGMSYWQGTRRAALCQDTFPTPARRTSCPFHRKWRWCHCQSTRGRHWRSLLHPNTAQGSFLPLESYPKKTLRKNVPKSARKYKRNVFMPPGHPIILLKWN